MVRPETATACEEILGPVQQGLPAAEAVDVPLLELLGEWGLTAEMLGFSLSPEPKQRNHASAYRQSGV